MSGAFQRLYADLPRHAPGDGESLDWALELAAVPVHARILDAGCGPGADLAFLRAARPQATLVARDLQPAAIDRVRAAFPDVEAGRASMLDPPGRFDLIWSAGAAYGPGVGVALTAWAGHLTPGGAVAFSECLWRSAAPDRDARAFWARDYPAMTDLQGHQDRIAAAGYRILGGRWLGAAAWEAYYGPLAAQIARLWPEAEADADLRAVLEEAGAEIEIWRRHGGSYGYYLAVVRPE